MLKKPVPPVHVFIRVQRMLQKTAEEVVIIAAIKMRLHEEQDFECLAKDVVTTFNNSVKLPTWVTSFCIDVDTGKYKIKQPKLAPSRIFFT